MNLLYSLLCLVTYLFSVIDDNEYLHRGSKDDLLSITIVGNVSVVDTTFGFCHDSPIQ